MRESLRVRLVLWYALVLTLVVVLYGGAVVYQSWQAAMEGVDTELQRYAREVSKALKPVDGGRYDLELPTDAEAYFFRSEGDRIDLSAIDAKTGQSGNQAFTFIGGNAFTGAGQVRVVNQSTEGWLVQVSTDGDKQPEMELQVGFAASPLAAQDFIL